ncbi:MAG: PilN domain-containing protein [Deltaproteobacteria bacterium]|nr:PilN domain-containing protein [Deltaproteobacteria bacterium]
MIRINLAKKQSKGGAGGGLDLKNLNLASLMATLRGGGDGEGKKFDINGPIPKTMVAFALCYFVNDYLEGVKTDELKKIDVEIAAVEKERNAIVAKLAKIKGFEPLKKSLEDDERALRLKLDVVQKLLEDRSGPAKMLMQITQSIPEEVWLTNLAVTEDAVKLGGATPGYNQVSDFIKALNSTSQFSDITLSGIQEGTNLGENGQQKVQNFDLNAKRRHGN